MRKWEIDPDKFTHGSVGEVADRMLSIAEQYSAGDGIAATGLLATVLINQYAPDAQTALELVEGYNETLLKCVVKYWAGEVKSLSQREAEEIFNREAKRPQVRVSPIRTDEDHKLALARIDQLMGAKKDTPEGDELEVLAILVEDYEKEARKRIYWNGETWKRRSC